MSASLEHGPDLNQFEYLVSVDIGIQHLALVLLEFHKETHSIHDVVWFELIDITEFHHLDSCAKESCRIPHSKTISDWLQHIFFLHHELFELAKYILIERQPIQGHTAIEQLFFFKFREKAILIHPRSVHSFFSWTKKGLSYEQRKVESIKIFQYRLARTNREWLIDAFGSMPRKHDVSDAYIQAVLFLHQKQISMEVPLSSSPAMFNLEFLEEYRHSSFVH